MKLYAILLFAFLCCSSSWAQRTLTLTGRLRDFTPNGPERCADFEGAIDGVVTGIVENTLDGDEKPRRSSLVTSSLPATGGCFGSWFRDDPAFNLAFPHTIDLQETGVNTTIFRIQETAFFPLDGRGFGNFFNNRNYHFTFEVGASFTYQAGQVFRFSGDDDVWVFINNQLVVDIGGVHGRADREVNLDTLGLTVGTVYRFKFFFAERHTSESNFIMETSIELITDGPEPPTKNPINFCGVELPDHCAVTGDCPRRIPTFHTTTPAPRLGSFFEYNAISFGDFNGPQASPGAVGDTEGRVAAGGAVVVPSGYSIGDKVITTGALAFLTQQTYALIAGINAQWINGGNTPGGSVEPFGPGVNANPSPKEFVYSGQSGSVLPALATILAQPSGHSFNGDFAYGRTFYEQVANEFAALTPNANFNVQFSTLTITCTSALATSYVVNIPATAFNTNGANQVTSWALSNCNNNAQIIVNILGTENVNFGTGDYLRFNGMLSGTPEQIDASHRNVRILYNFGTANRVVSLGSIYGHLLMPNGNLNAGSGVIWGLVIAGQVSASHQINLPRCPVPENPEEPPRPECPYYENTLSAECLALHIDDNTYSFSDFNLISFGSFSADTGDIQGRAIVRNNFNVGNGYSVGDQLNTGPSGRDRPLPFSLIAGGSVSWGSGSLYPRNEGLGDQEYMYVGAFTGPQYLEDLIMDSAGLDSTLQAQLNRAQACYAGLQNSLAAKPANVNFFEQYSGIFISCPASANEYVMEIDAQVISRATWYALDASCDPLNRWVINVIGNTPVTFNGNHLPGISGGMIWNIIGAGRLINVNTQVQGTILAPYGILNQRGGFIAGNVIVGDVSFCLQINVPECPPFANPITIYTFTSDPITPGQYIINTYSTPPANQNQEVHIGNEILYIQGVGNNQIALGSGVQNSYPANTPVTMTINDPYAQYSGNRAGAISFAGKVSASVALVAALLMMVALF